MRHWWSLPQFGIWTSSPGIVEQCPLLGKRFGFKLSDWSSTWRSNSDSLSFGDSASRLLELPSQDPARRVVNVMSEYGKSWLSHPHIRECNMSFMSSALFFLFWIHPVFSLAKLRAIRWLVQIHPMTVAMGCVSFGLHLPFTREQVQVEWQAGHASDGKYAMVWVPGGLVLAENWR